MKRIWREYPKFSKRSLKGRNLAFLSFANFAAGFNQSSLKRCKGFLLLLGALVMISFSAGSVSAICDFNVQQGGECCTTNDCASGLVCVGSTTTVCADCDGHCCPPGSEWVDGACSVIVPPICCVGPGCPPTEPPGGDWCSPECGNFIIQPDPPFNEQCDDGHQGIYGYDPWCAFCLIIKCGNGIIQPYEVNPGVLLAPAEECDDGGRCDVDGDGLGDSNTQVCYRDEACVGFGQNVKCEPAPGDGCDESCQIEPITQCNDDEDNDLDGFCDWDGAPDYLGNPTCPTLEKDSACFYPTRPSESNWCPDTNQRIMVLATDPYLSNAHGAHYYEDYLIHICYPDIFGHEYTVPEGVVDVHACVDVEDGGGGNLVLKLSDESNAHSGSPDSNSDVSPYDNVDNYICYGDLECVYKQGANLCDADEWEREVISTSSSTEYTNLHLATSGPFGATGGYWTSTGEPGYPGPQFGGRVCCKSLGDMRWEDSEGNEIPSADLGDTAYAVVASSAPIGTNVIVNIREQDDDEGLGGDDDIDIAASGVVEDNSGIARIRFDLTQDVFDDGGDNDNEILPWEFYFTTEYNGEFRDSREYGGQYDGILYGYPEGGFGGIAAPLHREIYFAGVELEFRAVGADDDNLEFEWIIEHPFGEEDVEIPNQPITYGEFPVTFTEPGMRTVTLKTTHPGLNQVEEEEIAILIVASPYVFTYINDPFFKEIIVDSGQPHLVEWSAEDSYVVEVAGDIDGNGFPDSVSCEGGWCPPQTNNTPLNTNDPSGLTLCNGDNWPQERSYNVQGAPADSASADYTTMLFDWTFKEGINGESVYHTVSGVGTVSGSMTYDFPSDLIYDKWIDLSIDFTNGDATELNDRFFTLGQCLNNGNTFIEEIGGLLEEQHSTFGTPYCAGNNEQPGDDDDCCPAGHVCSQDQVNNPGCVVSDIYDCNDYDNPNDCIDDTAQVMVDPLPGEYITLLEDWCEVGLTVNPRCDWFDHNGDGVDSCNLAADCELTSCETAGADSCDPPGCTEYSCSYNFDNAECDGVVKTLYFDDYIFTQGTCLQSNYDPNICERPPIQVPCGRLTFDLAFFDYRNMIATLLVIFSIYSLLGVMRRKR
jgi:hypothetical protein